MIRKTLIGFLLVVSILIVYLFLWPVRIDPAAWTPPESPPLAGIYETNARLAAVERLGVRAGVGPEDISIDAQGRIHAGMEDGRILRFHPDGSQPKVFASTGGRPLGHQFDGEGDLVVADAYEGLLAVSPSGQIRVLATQHGGIPFRLTDDVDVAADGTIYFSDASSKFTVEESRLDILEHGANGRLLAYNPATKSTRLLLDKLYFANGVAVSPDRSFVLVCETSKFRVRRYWLSGPKAGQSDIFIENLPGFPDGISTGSDVFWLALFAPRLPLYDALLPHPFLRKVLARLPALQPNPKRHAFVLGLNPAGDVVYNLQDASPDAYAPVTSVQEHDGMLYLGSLEEDAVGRLPVPPS